MTRRAFVHQLLRSMTATLLAGPLSACAGSPAGDDPGPEKGSGIVYVPLGGRDLRELAARRVHHDGKRFRNPFGSLPGGRLGRLLRWKLLDDNRFARFYPEETVVPVTVDWEAQGQARGLAITFLKHSSVLIRDADRHFLVDPILGDLFWFIKDFTPLAFDRQAMPRPDHVLITHGHYDHLDVPSLATLDRDVSLVSPPGYDAIFENLGLHRRTSLDWFDRRLADGREITLLPCNHWTMRNPLAGPNTGLWGSYLLRTRSGPTIFLSGDTAYFDGFAQIGQEYDIDLAIFNLGAYEPRWFMAPSHINPEETVKAFRELRARHLMILHWGSFRLGDEPVHFPPRDIRHAMERAGLGERYIPLNHGQTLHYTPSSPGFRILG
jgi:L-ascorbate metabolism protein UlaG (beta-lactamase superfamily)